MKLFFSSFTVGLILLFILTVDASDINPVENVNEIVKTHNLEIEKNNLGNALNNESQKWENISKLVNENDKNYLFHIDVKKGKNDINFYKFHFMKNRESESSGFICILMTDSDLTKLIQDLKELFTNFKDTGATEMSDRTISDLQLPSKIIDYIQQTEGYFQNAVYADAYYDTQDDLTYESVSFIPLIQKINYDLNKSSPHLQGEAAIFLLLDTLSDLGISNCFLDATDPFKASLAPLNFYKTDNRQARSAYYIYEKIGISVILPYKEPQVKRFLEFYIQEQSSKLDIKDKCTINFSNQDKIPPISSIQDLPFSLVDYELCAQQNIYHDQLENKKEQTYKILKREDPLSHFYFMDHDWFKFLHAYFKADPTHYISIENWKERREIIDYKEKMFRWGIL